MIRKSLAGIAITIAGERIAFVPPLHNGMHIYTEGVGDAGSILRNVLQKGFIAIRPERVRIHASTGVEEMPTTTQIRYLRPDIGETVHLFPSGGKFFETRIHRKKVRARSLHFVFVELPTRRQRPHTSK